MLNRYIFIQTLIVFIIITFTASYFIFNVSAESLIYPACCFTVALVIWIFFSWTSLTHDILDLYSMFCLATLAFNCGQIILQVFNLNLGGLLKDRFEPSTLLETILYICLGFACIHLGALLKLSQKGVSIWTRQKLEAPPELLQVGLILIAVSVLPTLIVIKNLIDVVRTSGYFGIYEQVEQVGFDNIAAIVAAFFIPGLLFGLAGSKNYPKLRKGFEAALIFHAIIFIVLGRRGDGAETLVTYAIVRNYCIAPLRKSVLIPVALFFLVIVFPIMAVVRNISLDNRADFDLIWKAYQSIDNPASAALSEMGGSMQSISYTIDLVPKTRAYDLGTSYFYSAFSIFPNLFWSLHPSVAHGSPTTWLIKTVDPYIAEKKGGIGYSYIAETYLNFGWWGGPIILFFFGYWICGLVKWSQFTGDPVKIAMVASFFSSLLTFARADSQSVVRPLFWYALVPYILVRLLQKSHATQTEKIPATNF